MYFKRIYDDDLAQASYLIGCQKTGEAVVVDARRDIAVYQALAEKEKLTITHVTETHIHADYLSGSRELAAATGAKLYLSDEGGEDWQYRFEHLGLKHGDALKIGNLRLEARHTPGHTPEHLSFLLTDGAATDAPGFFLTGDFVFVGDIGRPDLLDESGIGKDTREPMARTLFASLRDAFLTLPDYVQVWPGHGSGSACGKALGAVPNSTVGYEKLVAWWVPFVQQGDVDGFVTTLLEGQPDAPMYFGRMKRQNRAGPALLGERPALKAFAPQELSGVGERVTLIDTRPRDVYERDAAKGALHNPAGKSFVTFASYVIDPEKDERDIVLLTSGEAQAQELRDRLSYVGIDNVTGYVTTLGNLPCTDLETVAPEKLETLQNAYILDVRAKTEYDAGHIPGAHQLHAGRVMWRLEDLPKDQTLVTHCQSGARNTVVSSALRAAGFDNIVELEGSYEAWENSQQTAQAAV